MTEYNNINNNFQQQEEESQLQLIDLWHMIWDHKWWYVVSVALCVFVAAVHLYRTPSTYVRTAKVLIDESSQDAAMRNLGVSTANMMRLRSTNPVMNEIEAFTSPDLMETVVNRLGLQTKYFAKQYFRSVELYKNSPIEIVFAGENPHSGFNFLVSNIGNGKVRLSEFKISGETIKSKIDGRLGDTLQTPLGAIAVHPTEHINSFSDDIQVSWANSMTIAKGYCSNLSVSLSGKETSVIVLSMEDTYPTRSTEILNMLIDVYNEVWLNNKNRSAINTAEFISARLVVIERELAAVEDALKSYKSSNSLADVKASAKVYIDESSQYATKAFEVNNQLSIANFIKDHLNDPANAMSLIPANLGLANTSVEGQIAEYNELVLQRDRLLVGSGVNNPMIADLSSAISAIRSAILRSIENLISTLNIQLEKINSQEQQILARISSSSGQELQLLTLERQQQITQDLYVFLLQKREENELTALVNVGNTRVLMNPNGSPYPVAPNKMMILFAALVLGCGIPFAFFFLKKMLDNTVKTKADLANLTVPFLVEIPRVVKANDGLRKYWFRNDNDKSVTKIMVRHGSRDMMNEAFRVLRTNLDLMIGSREGAKVIMLTSFNPNAGKTFTTMNIAASMALKGTKVLLLDLDLRKATLSKALSVNHSGVASYLNGKTDDYHKNLEKLEENLYILPVGSLPPNPTELLLTERFGSMIASMREEFDYIFVDCPPIDVVADASIIAESVDMTMFVMRADLMDKRVLPLVEELYRSGKYKHMALVLNGVDTYHKKYGYGRYGYGYGYGYGS